MKFVVYELERVDIVPSDYPYTDYRVFLTKIKEFDTEGEAIKYCKEKCSKRRRYTYLPVFGG